MEICKGGCFSLKARHPEMVTQKEFMVAIIFVGFWRLVTHRGRIVLNTVYIFFVFKEVVEVVSF